MIALTLHKQPTALRAACGGGSMIAVMVLTTICILIQAIGFFGGFTMFDAVMALFRAPLRAFATPILLLSNPRGHAVQTAAATSPLRCSSRSSSSRSGTTLTSGTSSAFLGAPPRTCCLTLLTLGLSALLRGSAFPALCELGAIVSVVFLKKRRW